MDRIYDIVLIVTSVGFGFISGFVIALINAKDKSTTHRGIRE